MLYSQQNNCHKLKALILCANMVAYVGKPPNP